jgi:hypothetical protein
VGRNWQPFFVKSIEKNERKRQAKSEDEEVAAAHRLYFFAVNGIQHYESDFDIRDVNQLLNAIRPIEENSSQPFLKLFTRTSLAVSRNMATVVLEPDQIHRLPDILCGKEVMTDGAGRISKSLAVAVTAKVSLTPCYFCCSFYGELGRVAAVLGADVHSCLGSLAPQLSLALPILSILIRRSIVRNLMPS